jgi:hypothetical protein
MRNKDVWAATAYDILVEVAGRYHEVIEYSELGEEIQRRSGVTTGMAIRNWIGGVLEIVVHRCAREGIPALTALVVRKHTGMVGEGYDAVLRAEGIPPLEDALQRENHAAEARLRCYRWAQAAGLPPDGGAPALAPNLAARVVRQRKEAQSQRPVQVCPHCHMAVPATGVCDNCG